MPKKILIAEDDSMSLSILRIMLESAGKFSVVTADNGEDAWKHLDSGTQFDVCIFDIIMPGLDGLALTNRMRRDPRFRGVPVILCTAVNDRATVDQAAALEVGHYIVKPYSRDHVLKQVRRLCTQRTPAVNIEPAANAAQRLGIDEVHVISLRQQLFKDVDDFSAALRDNPAVAVDSKAVFRANALKGAAINLGAHSLAASLVALEDFSSGRSREPLDQVLLELGTECARAARIVGTAVAL